MNRIHSTFKRGVLALLSLAAFGWAGSISAQLAPSEPLAPAPQQPSRERILPEGTIIYRSTEITMEPGSRLATEVRLPDGIVTKNNPSAHEAIREVFRKTVDVAGKGELNNVVDQLAGPDRERLEKFAGRDYPEYVAAAKHFRELWNKKYHDGFEIKHEDVIYGPQYVAISTGEIRDPGLVRDWPLNPTPLNPVSKTPTGPSVVSTTQVRLDRGRDVAIAVIPTSGGLTEQTVSLVHEAPDFWKVDIPDTVSISDLKDSLTQHLNWLNTNENLWPDDVNEAGRMVSRHVLLALYGL